MKEREREPARPKGKKVAEEGGEGSCRQLRKIYARGRIGRRRRRKRAVRGGGGPCERAPPHSDNVVVVTAATHTTTGPLPPYPTPPSRAHFA